MEKNIVNNMEELIGKTPLYKPNKWLKSHGLENSEFAFKLEAQNPSGSVKDRTALGMILALEKAGELKEGSTIIEASSGNMAVSLAAVAASRGYKAIFTMPDSMTEERRKMISAYGAKLVLTPGADGMNGAIAKAKELNEEIENSIIPSQFKNPSNPAYHDATTGVEIWEQTAGEVDILVAGVGTGGTISGAGKYLKEQNPEIKIFAVEPNTSAVISGENPGKHGIQGIGAGFVPDNLDKDLLDGVIQVETDAAKEASRELAKTEGLLVGISSGAALVAARKVLENPEFADKKVVTVLPDSGDRYLSTDTFGPVEE